MAGSGSEASLSSKRQPNIQTSNVLFPCAAESFPALEAFESGTLDSFQGLGLTVVHTLLRVGGAKQCKEKKQNSLNFDAPMHRHFVSYPTAGQHSRSAGNLDAPRAVLVVMKELERESDPER